MNDTQHAYATHSICVNAVHTLSVSEYGNPQGKPVVFLHGGPGSGCRPAAIAPLFDMERFRVIAPDQRGAGKSTPNGHLKDNTTQHLIADLETVRKQLGIPAWLVVGGSWGALLAVAYAQTHPDSVMGLVVRSFFFGDTAAMRRAFIEVPRLFYPDLYEQFTAFLDEDERTDPLTAYYRRLLHPDKAVYRPAIYMWHDYERALSTLRPGAVRLPVQPEAKPEKPAKPKKPRAIRTDGTEQSGQAARQTERALPNTPRMEAHYFSNNSFLKPDELITNATRLHGIKGAIVQGRYDMLCPPSAAYELLRHWSDGEIIFVDAAGHGQSEPGIAEALASAINHIAESHARPHIATT